MSDSSFEKASQRTNLPKSPNEVKLSVAQTGGPPEANGFFAWKAGLDANNQTWYVIVMDFSWYLFGTLSAMATETILRILLK